MTPKSKPRWKLHAGLVVSALAIYISTYVALSLQGRYEALAWGLNHVKGRGWVPRGFESNGDWNLGMVCTFFPLYWLDRMCWHTNAAAKSGRYPVNGDNYYMYGKPAQNAGPMSKP